jgi:hypothetical protein
VLKPIFSRAEKQTRTRQCKNRRAVARASSDRHRFVFSRFIVPRAISVANNENDARQNLPGKKSRQYFSNANFR